MGFDLPRFLADRGLLDLGDRASVSPLTGGYWNDTYRVRGPGVDWVVKRFRVGQGESLFPNLPAAEARALDVLRGTEVAPDPVAFFADAEPGPILIYGFHEGAAWREDVRPIAELLRRQHSVRTDGFRALPVDPDAILQQGDSLLAGLADDDVLAGEVRANRPRGIHGLPPGRRALVHTDVGPGNLIVGPAGPRLIDWQCPGLGDPCEDLWTFLSPAFQILYRHEPLSAAERNGFLEAYGEPATTERLAHLAPCFAYRMTAYCCLRRRQLADHDLEASARYERAARAELPSFAGPP